jgi:hypothetical protein
MQPRYVWMRPLLATLVTLGVLLLTAYLTYKCFEVGFDQVPKELLVLYVALVQALILSHRDGNGFYFGSSQGSANKSDTIDGMLNGETPE